MAEVFLSGFEECTTPGDLSSITWSAVNGPTHMTIDTGTKHSGAQSLKIDPSASTVVNVQRTFANQSAGWVATRFYINVISFGTAIDPTIFETVSNTNLQSLIVRLMRDGTIRLDNVIIPDPKTTTTVLLTGVQYRIETKHQLGDGTSGNMWVRLFLGDATTHLEELSILGTDTLAANNSSYFFGMRTNPSSTCKFYLDDVKIIDDADTWPGPGKTECITVISNSSNTWSSSGGGGGGSSTFANIDETPTALPNDITDYNFDATATNEDRFSLAGLDARVPSSATLKVLSLWARCRLDTAGGTHRFVLRVWNEAGTGTDGAFVQPTTTTWRILTSPEHQSYDLTGVTKSGFAAFDVGYRSTVGITTQKQITALFANVEWIDSAGAGANILYRLGGIPYMKRTNRGGW